MKHGLMVTTLIGVVGILSACQPRIPESGAQPGAPGSGVGLSTTRASSQMKENIQPIQSGALSNVSNTAAPAHTSATNVVQTTPVTRTSGSTSRGPRTSVLDGREVLNASPSNPAPAQVNNPGISDENDFQAVSSRQTIASDKARLEANRAKYAVVQPTALPSREEGGQPNVVAYALQTKHPVGVKMYRRLGLSGARKTQRNCAGYTNADEAQIDFLQRGGPQKDRLALDPDGDGYACNWNPAKYRR